MDYSPPSSNFGFGFMTGGMEQLQTAVASHWELDPVLPQEPPPKIFDNFSCESFSKELSKSANNNFSLKLIIDFL